MSASATDARPVHDDILEEVTDGHPLDASELKDILAGRSGDQLYNDLTRAERSAVESALRRQARRNAEDLRDDWVGRRVYHPGKGIGTIEEIPPALPGNVLDDVQPVTVAFDLDGGGVETYGLDDLHERPEEFDLKRLDDQLAAVENDLADDNTDRAESRVSGIRDRLAEHLGVPLPETGEVRDPATFEEVEADG